MISVLKNRLIQFLLLFSVFFVSFSPTVHAEDEVSCDLLLLFAIITGSGLGYFAYIWCLIVGA